MERSKTVQYGDLRIEIGRFSPTKGSFILMRLLGTASLGAAKIASTLGLGDRGGDLEVRAQKPVNPEAEARSLISAALMTNEDENLHRLIYQECLKVCSELKVDGQDLKEIPIPLVTGGGEVAHPGLRQDMSLQMRLVNDCLIFNLADFFAQGGLSTLTQPQATNL